MRFPRACRRPIGFQVFDSSIVEIEGEEYYPKKVNVKAHKFSSVAKEQIEKMGGKAEVI